MTSKTHRIDRTHRIATPLVMVALVAIASMCGTACAFDGSGIVEDPGAGPKRTPGRNPTDGTGLTHEPETGTSSGPPDSDGDAEGSAGGDATPDDNSSSSSSSGAAETSSESTGAEISSGSDEGTTGVWEGFDESHCGATCPRGDAQHDDVANACICAATCNDDSDCGWPETCLDGRCGITCADNGDCPYNTAPTMVCGAMPANGEHACMFWMRQ